MGSYMDGFIESFGSMQTWFFAIICAFAVLGLGSAWMKFKAKYAEKMAAKESSKSS